MRGIYSPKKSIIFKITMNHKVVISISIAGLLATTWVSWVTWNPNRTNSGIVRFLSIDDLPQAKGDERIRLGGLVDNGSIVIAEHDQLECKFRLKQGESTVDVKFIGTRPDLFKDDAEIIVEGNYLNDLFVADQLQTKCASRYEGELRNESSYNLKSI